MEMEVFLEVRQEIDECQFSNCEIGEISISEAPTVLGAETKESKTLPRFKVLKGV